MLAAGAFAAAPEVEGRHAHPPVVSFRAGKCIVNGTFVSPDPRRGTLQLVDGDDGLLRVQWMQRPPRGVEDDLIVIGDAYLERVRECTTGRVYVLRFTSSDKKMLFWLQEPDSSGDDLLIAAFNRHAGGAPSATPAVPPAAPPAPATPAPGAPAGAQQRDQAHQLRELLRSFAEGNTSRRVSTKSHRSPVSLNKVLGPDAVRILCEDREAIAELAELMPPGLRTEAEVRAALQCPQLSPTLVGLTQAVYSDAAPLLVSFGVSGAPSEPAARGDAMEAFAEALEGKFREQKAPDEASHTDPDAPPQGSFPPADDVSPSMDEDEEPPKS